MKTKHILALVLALFLNGTSYAQTPELPLPQVPKELRQPKERAAFILEHFWDGMDFRDTLRSRNREFMEQNFANYLSLFPHAEQSALPEYAEKLVNLSSADSKALRMISSIAEQYLNEQDSPVRNEEHFIIFLEAQMKSGHFSESEASRLSFLLTTAKKNRPGTRAADFAYITNTNKRATLHSTKADMTLLIFYAPDCEHCMEIIKDMRRSTLLQQAIKEKKLTVLAIYADGDHNVWQKNKDSLPKEWTTALDTDGIFRKNLYALPSLPVIYLLDKDKLVVLKETCLQAVEDSIQLNNKK